MASSEELKQPLVETRRRFLEQCGGALMGITIVGSVPAILAGCEVSKVIDPSTTGTTTTATTITVDISSLNTDNTALVTDQKAPNRKHVLIVRRSASDYLALSMECSHEHFEVDAPLNGVIHCSHHGSQYDLTGNVLNGPAEKALRRYPISLDTVARTVTVVLS